MARSIYAVKPRISSKDLMKQPHQIIIAELIPLEEKDSLADLLIAAGDTVFQVTNADDALNLMAHITIDLILSPGQFVWVPGLCRSAIPSASAAGLCSYDDARPNEKAARGC
jgi:hypothetical protein